MSNSKTNSKQNIEMTGAQVLLKTLVDSGVELMVGYTGGAIMPTFDTLEEFDGIRFIASRHEQGAGFIAQGYTRASGRLAPVLATSGPGATNTITAVYDAQMDSIPLLTITGQVGTKAIGTDAFQEADVIGMMYSCTKHSSMPLSADEIAMSVGESIHIATHGRPGAVTLDIPKDLQIQKTSNITLPTIQELEKNLPGLQTPPKPDLQAIQKAAQIINQAKRPVALVGHGIIMSDTGPQLLQFLEKASIPCSTTLHGISSLPVDHQLNLGMMGMHGEIAANRAIQNADLLISLGMRFDDRVTGKLAEYAKDAKVIHFDIDPAEMGKNVAVDAAIHGDLKTTLPLMIKNIDSKTKSDRQEFFADIQANRLKTENNFQQVLANSYGPNKKLLMSRIIHELSELTEGRDNLVSDVGQHQMFAAKYYNYQRFNSWFNSGGAGTMGFGLPAAIGVKLARPDEEVWSINGDGGFQMNIQELGVVLQEKLNLNILILNNSYLGMVRQWQDLFYKKDFHAHTELINPSFELIAKAYGIDYKLVTKVEEIRPALEWSKSQTKATIVEFVCDKAEKVYPMIPTNTRFEEMIEDQEDAKKKLGFAS